MAYFFENDIATDQINDEVIERFIRLDDGDIEFALKKWQFAKDKVLADLCQRIASRRLLKLSIKEEAFSEEIIHQKRLAWSKKAKISLEDAAYFVFSGEVSNQPYFENSKKPIMIWYKNGQLKDLSTASDMQNIHALSEPVIKYYLCQPEELTD